MQILKIQFKYYTWNIFKNYSKHLKKVFLYFDLNTLQDWVINTMTQEPRSI